MRIYFTVNIVNNFNFMPVLCVVYIKCNFGQFVEQTFVDIFLEPCN